MQSLTTKWGHFEKQNNNLVHQPNQIIMVGSHTTVSMHGDGDPAGIPVHAGRSTWAGAVQSRQPCLHHPSRQAIFEAIVCSHCIAFGACRTDANGTSQAGVELVVVDPSQAQCTGTAFVGLITKGIVIHGLNCGLIICRARDSSGLHARCWRSSRNTSACWKIDLGRCCAIQATLLAPSKQASSLAILEAIVCSHCVTLGACTADANGTKQVLNLSWLIPVKLNALVPHLLD